MFKISNFGHTALHRPVFRRPHPQMRGLSSLQTAFTPPPYTNQSAMQALQGRVGQLLVNGVSCSTRAGGNRTFRDQINHLNSIRNHSRCGTHGSTTMLTDSYTERWISHQAWTRTHLSCQENRQLRDKQNSNLDIRIQLLSRKCHNSSSSVPVQRLGGLPFPNHGERNICFNMCRSFVAVSSNSDPPPPWTVRSGTAWILELSGIAESSSSNLLARLRITPSKVGGRYWLLANAGRCDIT